MSSENINNSTLDNSERVSLKELILEVRAWFRFVLSKWLILLVCGFLGGVGGYIYASMKRPVYTATTTFVLADEKSGGGLGSLAGLASIAGVGLGANGGGIFQGDNIFELYKSRKMVEQTLLSKVNYEGKEELLIDLYIEFNNMNKGWTDDSVLSKINFNEKPKDFTRPQDSIMGVIVNDIKKNYLFVAKLDKDLSIIKADVNSYNEFFAKEFNKQIVKNVNDFYVQTKTRKSLENVMILQQKTDSVRAVMNGAIYSAAAITDATPNLNPTRQSQRNAPVQKSQFSAETNKAVLSTLVQNLELSKIALRKDAPLIQIVDEPIYPLLKKGFGKIKGLVLGGLLSGFLCVIFLIVKKILNDTINE